MQETYHKSRRERTRKAGSGAAGPAPTDPGQLPRVARPSAPAGARTFGTLLAVRGVGGQGATGTVLATGSVDLATHVVAPTHLARCLPPPDPCTQQPHAQPVSGTLLASRGRGWGVEGAGAGAIAGRIQRVTKDPHSLAGDEKSGSHHYADRRAGQSGVCGCKGMCLCHWPRKDGTGSLLDGSSSRYLGPGTYTLRVEYLP